MAASGPFLLAVPWCSSPQGSEGEKVPRRRPLTVCNAPLEGTALYSLRNHSPRSRPHTQEEHECQAVGPQEAAYYTPKRKVTAHIISLYTILKNQCNSQNML